jgi:hypothetical protein
MLGEVLFDGFVGFGVDEHGREGPECHPSLDSTYM